MDRVKFGLQINQFTWPGGAEAIGPTLARVTRAADDAGFDSIWVMDHFFQIRGGGPPEAPMLDGMTALAFPCRRCASASSGWRTRCRWRMACGVAGRAAGSASRASRSPPAAC